MEPKFEQLGAFKIAGLLYEGKNANNEIPALWGQFMTRIEELQPDAEKRKVFYGAARLKEGLEAGTFEYLASIEVESFDSLPEGMEGWEIPESNYAVFPVNGLSEIHKVVRTAHEWVSQSDKYNWGDGPCFELYPPTFVSDVSTFYYFVPVREKS